MTTNIQLFVLHTLNNASSSTSRNITYEKVNEGTTTTLPGICA